MNNLINIKFDECNLALFIVYYYTPEASFT